MGGDVLIFTLFFAFLIGVWAENWDRRGWLWALLALFISPALAALVLLIAGKHKEE